MIRDIAIGSIVGVAMLVSVCAAQADQRQPASGQASAPKTAAPPHPDEALVSARKAWSNGDAKQLEAAARHVPRDHLLADYPPYWRMSLRLRGPASAAQAEELDTDVARMLARHEGSAIAEMLRRDWLLNLGRRGEWQKFDAQLARYSRRDDVQVNCLAWGAPNPRSQPTRAELEQVLMAPRELPDTCNLLLEQVVRQQRLGTDAAMRRLHRALEAGSIPAIRVAADLLGIEPGALQGALAKPPTDAAFKGRREVALIALSQLARTDPKAAAQRLEAGVSGLTSADQVFAWSQIAAGGMRRMAPESLAWTQRAAKATVSDDTLNWMTRAALRDQNWPLVATLIDRMSDAGRDDPAWIYWRARALRNEGRLADSDWLLRRISDGFHFYGQLAAEDLGRLTVIPPQAPSPSDTEIASHSRNAGFRRALKFYELGLRVEGNREWNHQLPAMSDRELLAAAAWACSINVLDRCVNTADRTQRDHDFALRFVTPFREQVKRASGDRGIDPAWVYGLIRQESRFIMDARSVAGAQGLMQIMPATGRWIAQKLAVPNFRVELLSDRDTNIRFGTFYLKNVLDDLDGSPVLASAGYNAGPGRPRNWRSTLSGPVEGAIFAEIIPFHETRDYVKKVLSNATFYASLFTGQPQSLRSWLGQVGPQPAGSTTLP